MTSPNNLSATYVPSIERGRHLKEFSLIKDLIAMEFFRLEFDIISTLNFEVDTLKIEQLPLSIAGQMIRRIGRHVEKEFEAEDNALVETL